MPAESIDPRCLRVLYTLAAPHNLRHMILDRDPAPMIPLPAEMWEERRMDVARETGDYPTVPRDDEGIRPIHGGGLEVILPHRELATSDSGDLTGLVLMAHQERCRVAIRPWAPQPAEFAAPDEWTSEGSAAGLCISITPRQAEGHPFTTHPSLIDLADRAIAMARRDL